MLAIFRKLYGTGVIHGIISVERGGKTMGKYIVETEKSQEIL